MRSERQAAGLSSRRRSARRQPRRAIARRPRSGPTESDLDEPAHRDLAAWSRENSVDRLDVQRITPRAILAVRALRTDFGQRTARNRGRAGRARLSRSSARRAPRDRPSIGHAEERNRRAPFSLARRGDRTGRRSACPSTGPAPSRRPIAMASYAPNGAGPTRAGSAGFVSRTRTTRFSMPTGRPQPPQVCMDFVLDSYERAAGSWFAKRGMKPARGDGRLDFDRYAIDNRRGVLAFEKFAAERRTCSTSSASLRRNASRFASARGFSEFLKTRAGIPARRHRGDSGVEKRRQGPSTRALDRNHRSDHRLSPWPGRSDASAEASHLGDDHGGGAAPQPAVSRATEGADPGRTRRAR